MIRINIDGKGRPSWIADDMEELLYEQLIERLLRLGSTGMGCGWSYEERGRRTPPHGELTASFPNGHRLTITAPSPMDAIKLAARILSNPEA